MVGERNKPPKIVELEGNTNAMIEVTTENDELRWKLVIKATEILIPYFDRSSCITVRDKHAKE